MIVRDLDGIDPLRPDQRWVLDDSYRWHEFGDWFQVSDGSNTLIIAPFQFSDCSAIDRS